MLRSVRSLFVAVPLLFLLAAECTPAPDPARAENAQGWTTEQQVAWYTASQGSRLIPRAWLDNLEQPNNTAPFLDPAHIKSFRYLPNPTAGLESPVKGCPYDRALPLGFTVDCQSDKNLSFTKLRWKSGQTDREPWVGLNCSACHTTEMTYKGASIRADGGPALADFQSFTEALAIAVHLTDSDQARFDRFARKVLGAKKTPADAATLRTALRQWNAWNDKLDRLNDTGGVRYGFGRLDAIGHIFNKVSLIATPTSITHQTANPSDAPTSYPFLWNVPQLNRVEWNGLSENASIGNLRYGALGRNAGEVIGVYGDIAIKKNPGLISGGYTSSVNVKALNDMEAQLTWLHPPRWSAPLPPIDQKLADNGSKLFARDCSGCHTVPGKSNDLTEKFTVTLQPVFAMAGGRMPPANTDFWMACNALLDSASSGLFTGNKTNIVAGPPIRDPSPSLVLLTNAVTGVLADNKIDVAGMVLFASDGLPVPGRANFLAGVDQKQVRANACKTYKDDPANPKVVYKGRPLQGIWATAPYLHNGSVPNLWELLLPPARRSTTFNTGTREFDPKTVGYETAASTENSFVFQTLLDGNANTGHDYDNAGMTDAERWSLVEYMKTL